MDPARKMAVLALPTDELDECENPFISFKYCCFCSFATDLCLVSKARRVLRGDPSFCRTCDCFAWRTTHQMDHRYFRTDLRNSYWPFYDCAERTPAPRHRLTIL